MITDIHAHIFPDNLAANAIKSLSEGSGSISHTDGTLSGTLEYMRQEKIDRFILQNIAVTPKTEIKVNDFAIRTVGDNYLSFGSVHPSSDKAKAELKRLSDNGVKGIKLHCEYQDFLPCDERAIEIYKTCKDLDMAILFHGGEDLGFRYPFKATPERFLKVYKQVPYSKYIIAHMGGFEMYGDVVKYLADTLFNIDTSFAITRMSQDKAHFVIDAFGIERVLFGSDCPWESPLKTAKVVEGLKYNKVQKNQIFNGNIERLLKI